MQSLQIEINQFCIKIDTNAVIIRLLKVFVNGIFLSNYLQDTVTLTLGHIFALFLGIGRISADNISD